MQAGERVFYHYGSYPKAAPQPWKQAHTLLDAARGDRFEALYHVALSLGLRQGEALGLRWDDVDLDRRTVRVAVALKGKLALVEPKTAMSRSMSQGLKHVRGQAVDCYNLPVHEEVLLSTGFSILTLALLHGPLLR